jgi:putative hemolysin
MKAKSERATLVKLDPISARVPPWLAPVVKASLEVLLNLRAVNDLYRDAGDQPNSLAFCEAVLDRLEVCVRVPPEDLSRIPASGPILAVANHPFGGLDAIVLCRLLLSRRSDVKVLSNYLLSRIPEMASMLISVDPFGNGASRQFNYRGLRQAFDWLADGKTLAMFPAGAVAHWNLGKSRVDEPSWSEHVARLARRSKAAVVPIHFDGANSPLFHLAGLLHPVVRTALLPRELINKRRQFCAVRVGDPIASDEWEHLDTDQQVADFLRQRTCMLRYRSLRGTVARKKPATLLERFKPRPAVKPLGVPCEPDRMSKEISWLAPDGLLCGNGAYQVYVAEATRIPHLLCEIGRLREVSFRAVGEGSGMAGDIDQFDGHYHHLFVWHAEKQELVGAYRLGLTDEILARRGPQGLYTTTLFRLAPQLFERMGPAIELGRSFVRPEYQRTFSPLMLLWKGIGQVLARQPKYRALFGPVSVSGRYTRASWRLIASFLQQAAHRSPLHPFARPRRPFRAGIAEDRDLESLAPMIRDVDQLSKLVAQLEPDGRGAPILVQQYFRLGAKALTVSVDPSFGGCLDCLCVFDLPSMDRRMMERYMGREQSLRYRTAHGLEDRHSSSENARS